ncbi:MAG: septum formation protein Maf [candidate division Zixibacteria bacterium]|nr:septum formation protein Maf [candidate division Zixibacteria bacterium]
MADLLDKKKLILASSSPRRAEILTRGKVKFEIKIPLNYKEENIFSDPVTHVLELSRRKAKSVADQVGDGIILGADTIVVLDGEILGKPKNEDEALLFLKKLSGRMHQVYTGITLINKSTGKVVSDYDLTKVKFNQLDEQKILNYIATGEPMDKAGAYGIQGMGNFLVDHIEGSLDNVIGLPTEKLQEMLNQIV